MRADLHIHTTASDGRWVLEHLVAELKARSIGLFAITDHDTIASVRQAEALARRVGLAFLRGVEVSAWFDGRYVHILAYDPDLEKRALIALLDQNQAEMELYDEHIIWQLIAAGYGIDPDDYASYIYDCTRGGWKALNFLIDRGFCTGPQDFFRDLVSGLCEWRGSSPHPGDAIALIREAGGIPILAHPGTNLLQGVTDKALRPFLEFGIAGLECYSSAHNEATTHFCLEWCVRHDLIATGGSDSHGGLVGRELGIPVVNVSDLRLGELEERII